MRVQAVVKILLSLISSCLILLMTGLAGCRHTPELESPPGFGTEPVPAPTEQARRQQEGEEWSRHRQEWFESLHRAAPGTDWRALERRNWHAHLERRHQLQAELAKSGSPLRSVTGRWFEIGSDNLAGRTHQVAYDEPTDTLFLGSNLGGVWQGHFDADSPDPSRMSWQPVSDSIYGTSFQVLRLDGPPEVLLKTWGDAWTGEVHRSADGGTTWSVVGGTVGRPRRLLKTGDAGETVFVITDDPNQWWSGTSTTRLYRSQDLGASFQLMRDLGEYRADIWTSRTAEGPLYLLTDNQLEMSASYGDAWSVAGSLGYTGNAKATITGSEAGAPRLYAVVETIDGSLARKLFRSDDAGDSWSDMGEVNDFWGDLVSLAASTVDPDLVLYGGVEGFRSTDGGVTFDLINGWGEYYGDPAGKLHADLPSIDFVPLAGGGEVLFISTDGGTYYSEDGGATLHNISLQGLRISQYYSILSDAADPDQIMAGSQDQGLQIGDRETGEFVQLISGDYGHLTSSDGSHDLVYCVYPGFVQVSYKDQLGNIRLMPAIDFPDEAHDWLPAVLADPGDPDVFYLCARHIHRYSRQGDTWAPVQMPHDFQIDSGEYVSALAIAPTSTSRWYAGTTQGRFWYSTDAGQTWSRSTISGMPGSPWLTGLAILVDDRVATEVVVAGSGYSNPAVFRSTDGGASFTAMGAGLPPTTVYALAAGPGRAGDLYAATQAGPYRYDRAAGTWVSLLGLTAPMTSYWDVEALSDRIRFATYGRGIWDYIPTLTTRRAGGLRH
jgi:photosystem II stability/assembly factor-like uncharacterized protein